MSQRWWRRWAIGCGALLWGAASPALAEKPSEGARCMPGGACGSALPIDPCTQGATQRWVSLQLVSANDAAGRDGLLFHATLEPAGGMFATTSGGALPRAESISIVATDALGAAVSGTVELNSWTDPPVAWRPATVLAANTPYTLAITLDNSAPPSCAQPADVQQTLSITTVADLTAALPEPPLRAIAYGRAWSTAVMTCCEPRDTSACGGSSGCAKCWSMRREPMIAPLWDAPLQSPDPLEYALIYGSHDVVDPAVSVAFGTVLPDRAFWPLGVGNVMFTETQTEVCLTGAVRNFRTGQVASRARCTPVTRDDSGLAGVALPADALLVPPMADPPLVVGPADCVTAMPPYQRSDVEVAGSFHTHRDTCLPACGALLPIEPPQPVAGSSAPPVQNLSGDSATAHHGGGGCQVGAPGSAPSALFVGMALWTLGLTRRRRTPGGSV